jgi:3-dehydroquinate synthase
MRLDKKVRGGSPAFVLVRDIGDAFVSRDVDLADAAAVLEAALAG